MTEETQVSRGLAEEKRPKLRVSAVTISPTVVAKSKLPPHLQRRFEESSISRNNSPAAAGRPVSISPTAVAKSNLPPHLQRRFEESSISRNNSPVAMSPLSTLHKSEDDLSKLLGEVEVEDDYLEGAVQATMKDLEPSASAYGDYLDEDEDDEEDVSVVDDCPSPSEKARIKLVQLKKKTSTLSPVVSVFSTAFPFDEDKGKGKDNTDSYEGSYSETDTMVSDFRKIRQQLDQKKKAREDLITFAAAMMEEDLDF